MAFLAPFLPAILWSGGSAIVTGVASYFYFRSNGRSATNSDNTDTKGEIYNNVHLAVQENNQQNGLMVSLVAFLLILRLMEFVIYSFKSYHRAVKKRYIQREITRQTPPQQQQQNQV